ncbi:MAG: addiction module protein [Fimbriimonadaceae bacterium]|nr:addiction module protein [Fimbriimonadaceae bacterium]
MSDQTTIVLDAALALPPAERAVLADALYASLATAEDSFLDSAWAAEAADRLAAYDRGELRAAPAAAALARLRERAAP